MTKFLGVFETQSRKFLLLSQYIVRADYEVIGNFQHFPTYIRAPYLGGSSTQRANFVEGMRLPSKLFLGPDSRSRKKKAIIQERKLRG